MRNRKWFGGSVTGALFTLALSCPAHAQFTSFENFNSLTANQPLSGQNGWASTTNSVASTTVKSGPDGKLASAANTSDSKTAANYKSLGGLSILDGTTGTAFFQYTKSTGGVAGNTALNGSVTLTDVNAPANTAGDNAVMLNSDPTSNGGAFRARNNTAFPVLSTDGTSATNFVPNADTVYNIWFVVDNAANNYKVYLQSDADPRVTTQTQMLANDGTGGLFGFRDASITRGPNLDMDTFNFGIGSSGSTASLQVDNVYIDTSGANLANPAPEPATLALLGLAGGAALLRRRRA
jgi:hypothetical protein